MNFIDVIILILVFFAAYRGFVNGLIKELISFLSLIIGIYVAINFSDYFENILIEKFPNTESFVTAISFVLVFLVVIFSLKLAGVIINKIAKSLNLGFLNKVLGLFFGASKLILIISLVLFQLNYLEKNLEINLLKSQKDNSILYKPLSNKIIPKILSAKEKIQSKNQ
tara:strand:- start:118 stop:621 length:504 start_codon:yes stop_codon:yes gene_type:complete